jgi:hypothetical protein
LNCWTNRSPYPRKNFTWEASQGFSDRWEDCLDQQRDRPPRGRSELSWRPDSDPANKRENQLLSSNRLPHDRLELSWRPDSGPAKLREKISWCHETDCHVTVKNCHGGLIPVLQIREKISCCHETDYYVAVQNCHGGLIPVLQIREKSAILMKQTPPRGRSELSWRPDSGPANTRENQLLSWKRLPCGRLELSWRPDSGPTKTRENQLLSWKRLPGTAMAAFFRSCSYEPTKKGANQLQQGDWPPLELPWSPG